MGYTMLSKSKYYTQEASFYYNDVVAFSIAEKYVKYNGELYAGDKSQEFLQYVDTLEHLIFGDIKQQLEKMHFLYHLYLMAQKAGLQVYQ